MDLPLFQWQHNFLAVDTLKFEEKLKPETNSMENGETIHTIKQNQKNRKQQQQEEEIHIPIDADEHQHTEYGTLRGSPSSASSYTSNTHITNTISSTHTSSTSSSTFSPPITTLIILGCAADHRLGLPKGALQFRLDRALDYLLQEDQHFHIESVIFSGGKGENVPSELPSEGEIMRDYFRKSLEDGGGRYAVYSDQRRVAGKKNIQLIPETTSTSTRTNAQNSLKVLVEKLKQGQEEWEKKPKDKGDSTTTPVLRIGIVTHRFHQYRSLRVFQNVEAERRKKLKTKNENNENNEDNNNDDPDGEEFPSPLFEFSIVPISPAESKGTPQKFFWRELAAVMWYKWKGWI